MMSCLHRLKLLAELLPKNHHLIDHQMSTPSVTSVRHFNANRAAICRISRTKYCRLYPALLVYPDGSTVTVRHAEPQHIIQIPKLLEDCKTDVERRQWLSRRKKVETIKTENEFDLKFNQKQYLHHFKSKSRAQ
ncbi:39S ribosomal protein L55, mitochondrial-like [Oppia nitens]|uniref:39S ribosomal protein L55, mitochondrial-like n=1 Tax=Oppia nitens TaxID=1686743 RepID=UPI0023D981D5|nr:39S ribosomal protein L55, mitochondrial-like [Oppia nitens]